MGRNLSPEWAIRLFWVMLVGGLALSAYLAFALRGWYLPIGVAVAAWQNWSAEKSGLGVLRRASDGVHDVVLWPTIVLTYALVGITALALRLLGGGGDRGTRTQAGPGVRGGGADVRPGPPVH